METKKQLETFCISCKWFGKNYNALHNTAEAVAFSLLRMKRKDFAEKAEYLKS